MVDKQKLTTFRRIGVLALSGALVAGTSFGVVSAASAHTANHSTSHNAPQGLARGQFQGHVGVATNRLSVTTAPQISGVALVGQTLTLVQGAYSPSPDAVTDQWYRGRTAIAGATGPTYVVTTADAGHRISVIETPSLTGYHARHSRSNTINIPAADRLARVQDVFITGSPSVGETLTANAAVYQPASESSTFQWQRNGVDITGATGATYVVVAGDLGSQLRVVETDTKTGFHNAVQASNRLWVPAS